jgi:hypothetical protein
VGALADIVVAQVVGSTFVEVEGDLVGMGVGCKAGPLDNVLLRIKRAMTTNYAFGGCPYGWP